MAEFSAILIPFFITVAFILFTIFKALTVERVMQSVYWLILMLISVSFMFLMANSEFLFAIQLMVYSGGIAVLMLFAGMLTEQDELFIESNLLGFARTTKFQIILFVIFALDIILLIANAIGGSAFPGVLGDTSLTYDDSSSMTYNFAEHLWSNLYEIIIIVSFCLLAAILGSVKLAIREQDLEELSDEYMARMKLGEESVMDLPGMEEVEA